MFPILVAVEQVAGEQDGYRPEMLHLFKQPMEIFLIHLLGNGDAGLTEVARLAEMQIRQHQGLLLLQVEATPRAEPDRLSPANEFQGYLHVTCEDGCAPIQLFRLQGMGVHSLR